jgi:acetyl-CoA carboxylase carboxyltransferase component
MGAHPMWDLIEQLEKRKRQASQPGTEADVERHLGRGKLLPRARIDLLLDAGTFREIDQLVYPETDAESMEGRKRLTDGVVTGWGRVEGRPVFVFSQDPTVVGGSLGEAGGRKVHKLMDLAAEVGAPIVGINDGGGARIQEGVAALSAYGGVFARNVRHSGVVPQISVVLGVSTGGAVYHVDHRAGGRPRRDR